MALEEHHAIDEVVERLSARFPEVPPEEVLAAVRAQHAKFDASIIRDFVPVLVEHAVSQLLTRRSTPGS